MELIIITAFSVLLPIMTIVGFIVGYNVNAPKKILKPLRKNKETPLSEDEAMLERIDKARV